MERPRRSGVPEASSPAKKGRPGDEARARTDAFLAHLDEVLAEMPVTPEQVNPHL